MQKKSHAAELSRLRQAVRRLLGELEKTLRVVLARAPLVKGNVYELARKCGKPNCACTRGRLHRTLVLSWSEGGKTRLYSIPIERRSELRKKSEEYLRFRRARARVSAIAQEILKVVDQIEQGRREKP